MTKSWKVKIIALGLCAVLFGSTGFGLFGFGTSRASGPVLAAATDLEDVTGQYSLDAIKESQYNSSVQKNTFPEKGEGNVIVQIKGDSVYDRYAEKDRSAAFSEFVASAEGNRYTDSVSARQDKVLAAMRRKGINYEFKYAYTAIANAVAVKVSYDDVAAIEKIDGVEGVYYSNTYAVPEYTVSNNNANVYSTGIYNTDGIEESGEGMKVAILDTGLDYTHAAFQTMPDEQNDLWHEDDIAENFDKLLAKERVPSLQVSDVYVNAKVPYAFDYADNDANVYPSYSNHGTHVAGIIGGRDDNKKVGEEGSDETFVGVAPQAQLVIMKVFTDDLDSIMLGGADSADILAAVHDCAVLGVDVINMSLGTSCGFTSEDTDDFLTSVYEQVRETGISLIVAASNESSSGNGGGNGLNLATNPGGFALYVCRLAFGGQYQRATVALFRGQFGRKRERCVYHQRRRSVFQRDRICRRGDEKVCRRRRRKRQLATRLRGGARRRAQQQLYRVGAARFGGRQNHRFGKARRYIVLR